MDNGHDLPKISCKELRKIQDAAKPHAIIDVRDAADYEAGHVEGSVHIPFAELETNLPNLVHDKNELVAVIGERPEQAAETHAHMEKAGYKHVRFLLGGFDEWCKPAEPDISDLTEDAKDEAEQSEDRGHHGEDIDNVEQGTQDEPLM
jgi:rhodanese-related sulfurtransferase